MAFEILEQVPGHQTLQFEIPLPELQPQYDECLAQGLNGSALELALTQSVLLAYLQERHYALWAAPHLSELQLTEQGLEFRAALQLLPKVALPEYCGIRVEVPPVPVPDQEDLLERVSNLQLGAAKEETVAREISWGDRVYLDLVVTVGQQPVPLSARVNFPVLIEPELFFPGFAEALIGHKTEDAVDITTHLPMDYEYPAWRGREAIYNVFIRRVCSLQLPPLDEHFPALVGKGSDSDTMMQTIYDEMLAENQLYWQDTVAELLMAKLVPACEFELPEDLIQAEQLSDWERLDHPALREQGLEESLIEQAKTTWMKFRNLREEAYWRTAGALVLRAVAIQEGFSLSSAEWQESLDELAGSFGHQGSEMAAELRQSGELSLLADRLLLERTLRWLVSQAELVYEGQPLSAGASAPP
ncbi:hypothetical protein COW36_17665 [bacterium (Candidatus Blackallbacteria) CG17_big_fil_post_rev_8_21_14_2_50_48_46]|uniref:Trigger factor n=1 Tax=bacterium (Candidatus Blackallbacteria) CG17_big_fil_post_rev_8_21_14_2_50_48_46 TaxID=2014261 RepID=A0A2M7G130_9BACT|nr:MAG: hypothetical protein COW64_01060 [bacterium (Candidatus Blackallbacteria) CG18_big_fil_WC_8_21_14_2_50_49_26]PIW15247.1 MAG: hypothetical protein COW36_17665 [bacterium (Candidatus Blackallbacteria) CG17_big_fil_post_rev_8_21_14_2_50_48_46]PIW45244.1 MAG: hypothetical protein COW20_21350 [bacterium (Candidatus Blackallbacteria) CG13_big_fil_rev_8_21_14_2_50_49_14]